METINGILGREDNKKLLSHRSTRPNRTKKEGGGIFKSKKDNKKEGKTGEIILCKTGERKGGGFITLSRREGNPQLDKRA